MATVEETLRRTVALKVTELPMTPARGFSILSTEGFDWARIRQWRCVLTRKGQQAKTTKALSLIILSPEQPTITKVLECLAADIAASKVSLWDFGTTYAKGRTDEAVQNMHKTCRRTAPRVLKFFGEQWPKIAKTLS